MLAAGFPHVGIGFLGVSLAFGLTVLTIALFILIPVAGAALAGLVYKYFKAA
jgi:aquaporin Z